MAARKTDLSLEKRFWAKVDKRGDDECWPWLAMLLEDGYGQISEKGKMIGAHRASWKINRGPIPKGKWVLHSCDNRKCMNPKHLFLGDQIDNVRDMDAKGRRTVMHGTLHKLAILNPKKVRQIRRLSGSMLQKDIGKRFGISQARVSLIVRGEAWRSVQ